MKILLFDKLNQDLINDWTLLWQTSFQTAHFFNSPEWFIACQEIFGYSKLFIVTCYDQSKLVGVLPLVESRKTGFKALISPGIQYLDKSTLLYQDNNSRAVKAIFKSLKESGHNFYLSELNPLILSLITNKGIKQTLASTSLKLELDQDPFRNLSNRFRRKAKSILKDESSHLELKPIIGFSDDLIQLMADIEKNSSKKTLYKDIFSDLQLINLFKALDRFQRKNILNYLLYYKGLPICYRIGFLYGKTHLSYNTAYDANYNHLVPGKLLKFLVLKDLIAKGVKTADFSRGDNQLKREFTKDYYYQYSLYYSSNKVVLFCWTTYNFIFHFLEKNPQLFEIVRVTKNQLTSLLGKVIKIVPKVQKREIAKL
jgi:CelD/BcsL family acetyltransferase involved in cellulose biosynthesis